MTPKEKSLSQTAETVIKNLNKRNMEGFYFATKEEALDAIMKMMKENTTKDVATVSSGGSETLVETNILEKIKSDEKFNYLDRFSPKNEKERDYIFSQIAICDYYLMSSNAITLEGELVNIDGNGNRVASLIHGPKNVYIIAGMNKIVADTESAIKRVRNTATPPNCVRLGRNTPCASVGRCMNCLADDCICNQIVVTRRSGHTGRIKVFLIGEELGY